MDYEQVYFELLIFLVPFLGVLCVGAFLADKLAPHLQRIVAMQPHHYTDDELINVVDDSNPVIRELASRVQQRIDDISIQVKKNRLLEYQIADLKRQLESAESRMISAESAMINKFAGASL